MADSTRDPDVLTAKEAAARLRLRKVDTLHHLADKDEVPYMQVTQRRRLYSWTALYELVAGPGVPAGEILVAREVGALLGLSTSQVHRNSVEPGSASGIPGHKFGPQWRYARPAITIALRSRRPAVAAPAGEQAPPS